MNFLDSIPDGYIIFRYGENHAARLSVRTLRAHMDSERGKHRGTESLSEVQKPLLEYATPESGSLEENEAAVGEEK
jgi:hypothetical protein